MIRSTDTPLFSLVVGLNRLFGLVGVTWDVPGPGDFEEKKTAFFLRFVALGGHASNLGVLLLEVVVLFS